VIKIKKHKKNVSITHLSNEKEPLHNYNLGVVLFNNRQYDEAIAHFQQALEIEPNLLHAYNYIGNAFQEKKQFDGAITYYQKAISINPADPTAYMNLGILFQNLKHHEKALRYFNDALKINPTLYQAHDFIGFLLDVEGHREKAAESYRASLEINPHSITALINLGNLLAKQGKLNEAEHFHKLAMRIDPNNFELHQTFLCNMLYNPKYDTKTIFSEYLQAVKKFAGPSTCHILPHANERTTLRKLKIGYVSPDFRRHPVAYFIEPVLAAHNREFFEVFCYSNSDICDDITERLKKSTDHWRTIYAVSDEMAAELIRADRIDILIDLAGHTANNRILLFARKPAPVQVNWMGFPPTTGLSAIDYKIVDHYTDPPEMTEQFYSEKLMRLPESFVCFLPDRGSPDVGPLPALTTGYITFGSFNNLPKVTPHVVALWGKILNSLPDSCLIMKNYIFSDTDTCQYVADMFVQVGISKGRIILQSADPSPKHLKSYNAVDIGLDTFPFNGLTTTCEAMWMGVPVITLAGTGYAARAGVGLLSTVGLSELIANTQDEYIKIARSLALDINRLILLRSSLRDRMAHSPLIDAQRFIINVETCYREMWKNWCESHQQ
jgi:protein O-GlcNAc transferase